MIVTCWMCFVCALETVDYYLRGFRYYRFCEPLERQALDALAVAVRRARLKSRCCRCRKHAED